MTTLAGAALYIVEASPHFWWLWAWGFFAVVTLFLIYLSPYVLEPLFNTYEPLKDEVLELAIRGLMKSVWGRHTQTADFFYEEIGRLHSACFLKRSILPIIPIKIKALRI